MFYFTFAGMILCRVAPVVYSIVLLQEEEDSDDQNGEWVLMM